MREKIRTVVIRPYRRGMGPTFRLDLFSCGYSFGHGKERLGYRLTQFDREVLCQSCEGSGATDEENDSGVGQTSCDACSGIGTLKLKSARPHVVFEGDDFYTSPFHAIDSDETVAALMGFLTLRLGDIEPEYFDKYNDVQCEFRDTHAESVAMAVLRRFERGEQ